jgi:aspartyl-tRNA(Asn)/glutamyl-tRNA(Gln) amidotransferase subunit A
MTVLEAAAALRAKKISSVELTRECLKRIAASKLNAFITVIEEAALARASAMDAERSHGIDRGPLHGVPFAHKDLVLTKGIRTTAGSKLYANFVPNEDAEVEKKLQAAGAVLVGKTGLHELAYGITSNNPHFGPVRNPHDPERIPGGSSGGSGAAVAAGLVPWATGSDTGGSIRIPASLCGCVGLKPTFGRVSKKGVFPLGYSLDHMGPLTRTVKDAAAVLDAISERKVSPASTAEVRIGVPENFYFDRLHPEVVSSVRGAVKTAGKLGFKVSTVRVPDIDALNAVARVLLLVEATSVHRANLHRRAEFGTDVLALLDQGLLIPATDYVDAQRLRRTFLREFENVWRSADCIIIPANPAPAAKIGQATFEVGGVTEDVRLATTRLMRGLNVLGVPVLALPCGMTQEKLPIGLQIVAPAWREHTLFRVGAKLEEAIGFRGLV